MKKDLDFIKIKINKNQNKGSFSIGEDERVDFDYDSSGISISINYTDGYEDLTGSYIICNKEKRKIFTNKLIDFLKESLKNLDD